MYKTQLRSLALFGCIVIASPVLATGSADTTDSATTVSAPVQGPQLAQGMMGSGGMSGSGMMHSRMMGSYPHSQRESGTTTEATDRNTDALTRYVNANGLTCFSCHTNSGRRVGPSFDAIAQRYAGKSRAQRQLARSIRQGVGGRWSGFPQMPPGQVTQAQADQLARLILERVR